MPRALQLAQHRPIHELLIGFTTNPGGANLQQTVWKSFTAPLKINKAAERTEQDTTQLLTVSQVARRLSVTCIWLLGKKTFDEHDKNY
jgi:hypothetical protein